MQQAPHNLGAALGVEAYHHIFLNRHVLEYLDVLKGPGDPHPGNLFVRPRPDIPWEPEDSENSEKGRPFWLIFVDFGMVRRFGEGGALSRMTQGAEIKGNIVIGKLPILTLAYGQARDQDAWQDGAAITYVRLGLVSPF